LSTAFTKFSDVFQARGVGVGVNPEVKPKAKLQVRFGSRKAHEVGDRASTVAHFVGFVSFTITSLGTHAQGFMLSPAPQA
jgi:hypothetical protein